MLLYTMKNINRGHKLASYSHTFYSQSAEGVALLYSASSFNLGQLDTHILNLTYKPSVK